MKDPVLFFWILILCFMIAGHTSSLDVVDDQTSNSNVSLSSLLVWLVCQAV